LTATAQPQDTRTIRLFLGDHLAGATWVDGHRGPIGEPPAAVRNPGDPRLRLRLLIAGRVADETWLDADDPDAQRLADITTAVHSEGVDACREYEVPWLIEVYRPAEPAASAYLRVGSDVAAMAAPVTLTLVNGEAG
jgi:hypothetical protein